MKWNLAAVVALVVAGAACSAAPSTAPQFDAARLSAMVKILSSDAFEGRGPATPAEQRTVDWIIDAMKQAGLEPGGAIVDGHRDWTQPVPLARFSIEGEPEVILHSPKGEQRLVQGGDIAVRATMDGSGHVDIHRAPLVFVGYGISAPERDWDDYKDVDLRGKIAVALVNDPDFETGEGAFGGEEMTYYGRWTYKYEEAARRGALGMLVIHETRPASYGWATVRNSNTNVQFDIVRERPADAHPHLEGWIQHSLAQSLFQRAGLDFDAQKKRAQTRDFKPVLLDGETLSARFGTRVEHITSRNVAGRLVGSKYPDETVVYSAHWDHLGIGAADTRGDRIYNGAVDNATGIAALIELGRAFAAGPRPERSLLFLAVTAEEKGLLGSEYYANQPLYPLATTVADINTDALDPGGVARNFSISGTARFDLLDRLIAIAKRHDLRFTPDPHPGAGGFFRSDHFAFAKRGVPALSYGSGNDLVEGGTAEGERQAVEYTRLHYHQPSDEWQADWSFAGMAHDLAVLHELGLELANSGAWPNWAADSEFRAIRDASADERRQ